MATKVLMPQLGESVTEGTITKWLVKVGDVVKKYDPLAEVTTDKVNAEVPSTVSGRVTEIVVPEGETVAVGTLILYIEEEGGAAEPQTPAAADVSAAADTTVSAEPVSATPNDPSRPAAAAKQQGGKQRYSPAVLRLAQEHGIDLSRVQGTGLGGRVTRKDVQAIIDAGGQPAAQRPDAGSGRDSGSGSTCPAAC